MNMRGARRCSPVPIRSQRALALRGGGAAIFLILLIVCVRPCPAAAPTEYQLKAAFLLNFAKFVEWPATAFSSSQSPILICILGDDPFGGDLDATVKGQTIGERAIAVKRSSQMARDDSCQVVFVGSGEGTRQRSLAAAKFSAALTVIEHDEVVDNVVINLIVEENKIRFEINMDAADRAGLKISSKLLRLAKSVRERRKT